jgi:SAM-dependent methyltransferase
MTKNISAEIHEGLDGESTVRLEYTRRAFRMLPALDRPRILDVGCGRGAPALELARLSGGEVVGLDVDQPALDAFAARMEAAGVSERVRAVNRSMFEIDFPDASFDIIWIEGAIHVIGFERGLREWRRLIKPRGYMVVHEMAWLQPDPPREIVDRWRPVFPGIRTVPEYVGLIPRHGYELVGHFALPEDVWLRDYFDPLEERIGALRQKYAGDRQAQAVLDREQREVDLHRAYARWYGSAFFLMQKR